METWITAMGDNGCTLQLAWEPPVHVVDEKEYDFEAYEWPWMKTDVPATCHCVVCVHARNKMRVCMEDILFDNLEQDDH